MYDANIEKKKHREASSLKSDSLISQLFQPFYGPDEKVHRQWISVYMHLF